MVGAMNFGQSPYWPGLVTRVMGLHRRAATRRTLVVSPPRERRSASRAARAPRFLSSGSAPWPRRAGRGGRQQRAGARALRWSPRRLSSPSLPPGRTRPATRPGSSPRSRPATSGDAARRRCSSSRTPAAGHVTAAGPGPEQDPVDHRAVVDPTVPLPRLRRHQRRQPLPFLIGQVMTIQQTIHPERSTPCRSPRSIRHALVLDRIGDAVTKYKPAAGATIHAHAVRPSSEHRQADIGTVQRTVFPARHAGLRSGGMGTVSDDIGCCECTQERQE
jgi:hypothetical protein